MQLRMLTTAVAPVLLAQRGVGPISAAQVLISWSHPGRFRSRPPSRCWLVWRRWSLLRPGRSPSAQPWRGSPAESGLAHHRDGPPDPSWADPDLHHPPHRPGQEPARHPPLPQAHPRPPALPTPGAHRCQPSHQLTRNRSINEPHQHGHDGAERRTCMAERLAVMPRRPADRPSRVRAGVVVECLGHDGCQLDQRTPGSPWRTP